MVRHAKWENRHAHTYKHTLCRHAFGNNSRHDKNLHKSSHKLASEGSPLSFRTSLRPLLAQIDDEATANEFPAFPLLRGGRILCNDEHSSSHGPRHEITLI